MTHPLKAENVRLSEIAQLILSVEASLPGEDQKGIQSAKEALAIRLGCKAEDIEEVIDSYGRDVWNSLVAAERIRRGLSGGNERDVSWDRLESVVLRKLLNMVEGGMVKTISELAALGKIANQAQRSTERRQTSTSPGVAVQLNQNNYYPGDPNNGVLPAGNLGKMTLTLTHRVKTQLEGTVNHEKEDRTLDSMQMLSLQEIQAEEKEFSQGKMIPGSAGNRRKQIDLEVDS